MRILHVVPYLENGGTEKAVALLANGLANRGHHQYLFAPFGPALSLFQKIEYIEMPKQLLVKKVIQKIVVKNNVDLIHIHAARQMVSHYVKPVVFTPHAYYNKLDQYMVKLFAKNVDVICFTKWEKLLLESLGIKKTHIIPNGIKSAPLLRKDKPNNKITTIGFLGRLTKDKGIDILLEELSKVSSEYELLIAGEGEERKNLEKQAKSLNIPVSFLGFVEPYSFLSTLDIFVLPSRTETFGLALVEAMSLGLTCVSSDVCGLKEILNDAGIAVPHAKLGESINNLINDPYQRELLGVKALKRFEKHFSLEKMVLATEKLYFNSINDFVKNTTS